MRSQRRLKIYGIARLWSVALLAIACLAALVAAGWLAAQTPTARQAAVNNRQTAGSEMPSAQETNALQEKSEKLREEASRLREESTKLQAALDEQRHEADGFRWLLTVVLGLGALYSLFQAIYSYLNVKELKEQARKAIDDVEKLRKDTDTDLKAFQKDVRTKAEEDFEKFRSKCEIQFPMFIGFETALGQMSSKLEALLKSAAIGDNFYHTLDDNGRQEIYYYEKSAAAFQFVEVSRPGRLLFIFLGFSRFYVDKYRTDRAQKPPVADLNDLMRARYYLHRADNLPGGKDFRVLNLRGYMAVYAEAKPDWDEAKMWFEQSANLKQEQQCAHYNVALIDHEKAKKLKTGDPPEAKKLLEAAVKRLKDLRKAAYKNWEDEPLPSKATSIDYNLACGLSLLAELEPDAGRRDDLLKESFEALERAVQDAPEERGAFKDDLKVGGDLHKLSFDPLYQPKLDEFAAKIRKAQG